MHTDEYEISLAREIVVCQRFIRQTGDRLEKRDRHYGMRYPEACAAAGDGRLDIRQEELDGWRADFEALPQWRQRLDEYQKALAVMRVSAAQG